MQPSRIGGEIKVTLNELEQGKKESQWINNSKPGGDESHPAINTQEKKNKKVNVNIEEWKEIKE